MEHVWRCVYSGTIQQVLLNNTYSGIIWFVTLFCLFYLNSHSFLYFAPWQDEIDGTRYQKHGCAIWVEVETWLNIYYFVKKVCVWSFSGSYFSALGLTTDFQVPKTQVLKPAPKFHFFLPDTQFLFLALVPKMWPLHIAPNIYWHNIFPVFSIFNEENLR